jgi:(E)-4-hydroxy-3-methylbut-2-enyl-diphosphate synthase
MTCFNYKRRKTSETQIGDTPVGGENPVRIQSMTNTNTNNTEASTAQIIRIIEAGADYVRLTAQGVREAENLKNIRDNVRSKGYATPLIADIHFNPKAAEAAAKVVEKVRINPGNFVDRVKTFANFDYTDEEYAAELEKIRIRLLPLLAICKKHRTALRIGVNHGSLSDRIMSRYGDTPEGIVESCMEFLRICVQENFRDIVISIKASNTAVMTKSVRLLVARMNDEGLAFPLHLGVTEAGDGEDGRIKSAVGIGALLADGIGDTVRVSLSEAPEYEIPVAKKLVEYITHRENHPAINALPCPYFSPFAADRRKTYRIGNIGGDCVPAVISDRRTGDFTYNPHFLPDYIYAGKELPAHAPKVIPSIIDAACWQNKMNAFPLFDASNYQEIHGMGAKINFLKICHADLSSNLLTFLKQNRTVVLLATTKHINPVGEWRAIVHTLMNENIETPVVFLASFAENETEDLQIKAGADFGTVLLDGFGNGVMLENAGELSPAKIDACLFGILQAARVRTSKTEYISCPSCGRTLFDLQTTISEIKAATSHLTHLKIGIMGCIVNGPGEMADADYGYVGAERGKVTLYRKKQPVEKNIPSEQAVERLIRLIKDNGDWVENPSKSPEKE